MRDRAVSRAHASAAVVTAALVAILEVIGLTLLALGLLRYETVEPFDYWREAALNSVPFGLLTVVLLLKRPENRVSWLFAGLSLSGSLQLALGQFGTLSFRAGLGWPLEIHSMWASSVAQLSFVMFFILIFLYFPTGKLVSPAWRPVAFALGIGFLAQIIYTAVAPIPLDLAPSIQNPFGLEDAPQLLEGIQVISAAAILGLIGAIVTLVVRFRRSGGIERQQLKWFVFTTIIGVVVLFGSGLLGVGEGVVGNVLWSLVPAAIAVSAGVAILRYRLYDIDLVINRTLVYVALTATLVTTYLVVVVVLQGLLSPLAADSDLAVAGSTLAVAGLFRPLRARLQSFIDRRFYRRKYDAAETLDRFSSRLRAEVDLDSLTQELVTVVGSTMQPRHASLWLRDPAAHERAAV